MKSFSSLLFCLIIYSYSFSQSSKNDFRAVVDEIIEDTFIVNDDKKIEKYIRKYLKKKISGRFATSQNKYNGSDIHRNFKLSRYIVYIASSKKNYLISYMHGGRGEHQHLLILKIKNKKIDQMVNLSIQLHDDLEELIKILKDKTAQIEQAYEL